MIKIQIYGKGCPKCNDLAHKAEEALRQTGKEGKVEHVADIGEITRKGIMLTPALVIGDEVVSEGKVLSVDDIVKAIRDE
ncbi:MAG: thioredoxin family protein [Candidatus Omnitrophica bacterium]|nr:thioredoxin family protein [Candidatus Omnitrophota bacterium]